MSLKSLFDPDASEIKIPGSPIRIVSIKFNSDIDPEAFFKTVLILPFLKTLNFPILFLFLTTKQAEK